LRTQYIGHLGPLSKCPGVLSRRCETISSDGRERQADHPLQRRTVNCGDGADPGRPPRRRQWSLVAQDPSKPAARCRGILRSDLLAGRYPRPAAPSLQDWIYRFTGWGAHQYPQPGHGSGGDAGRVDRRGLR